MKYVRLEGSNNHTIITLHGTGGSASSLFSLAERIDPLASKVGFQGDVLEHGMSRYFARYPQGGFDLESLEKASHDLHDSIKDLICNYKLQDHRITILGYSNGANLAKDLLKRFDDLPIHDYLLFHPSLIDPEIPYKQQEAVNLFITSGKRDPYISQSEFDSMVNDMREAGINVETFTHDQGHELIVEEINHAKLFLNRGERNKNV